MDIFTPAFEFLTKLERLNFNKVDNDTLINADGFKLSYNTKLQSLIGDKEDCQFDGLPVQLLFRLTKNNVFVARWGCEGLEDTTLLAKWFVLKKIEIESIEYKKESQARKEAEAQWAAL